MRNGARSAFHFGSIVLVLALFVGHHPSQASFLRIMDNLLSILGIDFEFLAPSDVSPESYFTVPQLIEHYGYKCEIHVIEASDGQLLEMHRIPGRRFETGKSHLNSKKKHPVLMMHCVLCSSGIWVSNGLKDSLGFQLADEGYDVWLANLRGNTYSRKHRFFSPDDDNRFWEYGFDDHALIDIPTMIDYVLKTTDSQKFSYIGHSLGSFLFVLLLSDKPEYNEKVHTTILLAPYVYGKHFTTPFRFIKIFFKQFEAFYSLLPTGEVFPSTQMLRTAMRVICSPGAILNWLCQAIVMANSGYNEDLFDNERLHIQIQHAAAGTSFKVATHFVQVVYEDNIHKFDYGSKANSQRYGQIAPPIYNFSRITTPLILLVSEADPFTNVKDVDRFVGQLSCEWTREIVPNDRWAHNDFIFAKNLKFHLNDRIVEILRTSLKASSPLADLKSNMSNSNGTNLNNGMT